MKLVNKHEPFHFHATRVEGVYVSIVRGNTSVGVFVRVKSWEGKGGIHGEER